VSWPVLIYKLEAVDLSTCLIAKTSLPERMLAVSVVYVVCD
jgi:hypothetical protein